MDTSSGRYQIILQGQSSKTYVFQASSNLVQWAALVTNMAGADGSLTTTVTNVTQIPARFYRAILQE